MRGGGPAAVGILDEADRLLEGMAVRAGGYVDPVDGPTGEGLASEVEGVRRLLAGARARLPSPEEVGALPVHAQERGVPAEPDDGAWREAATARLGQVEWLADHVRGLCGAPGDVRGSLGPREVVEVVAYMNLVMFCVRAARLGRGVDDGTGPV